MNAIDILRMCSDSYSVGDVYSLTQEDINILEGEDFSANVGDEVTDALYDQMYFYLKDKYPEDEFFSEVGAPERGGKVPLEFKMGSMNELKSGDWNKWKLDDEEYVITSKLDGISCGLTFEGGKLKCAQSRGNGIEGADITRHYNKFKVKGHIPSGKVRGEIIIPKADIEAFINEVEQETGKRYKNARNAVAGQMNSKIATKAFYKYANFVTYKLVDYPEEVTSFKASLDILKAAGFLVVNTHGVLKGSDISEESLINIVKDVKEKDPYECDGIILTLNKPDDEHLGNETGSLNPKDSRKFKIGATNLEAQTKVISIEWNPSKDYKLKPVAILEPVDLNGVTVSRATINNIEWLRTYGIGVGSDVIIKRCGEVIPNVVEVLQRSEDDDLPDVLKNHSHMEGVDLCLDKDVTDGSVDSYYAVIAAKSITYFCSSLKIEQAGFSNVLRVMATSGIKAKDYTLENFLIEPESRFIEAIGVNGKKLFESLRNKLSSVSEPAFFAAVDIFGSLIAEKRLEKVYETFGTLDVTASELNSIPGFGNETTKVYQQNLPSLRYWKGLCNNQLSGLIHFKQKEKVSDELKDLAVVFTGIRDSEMEDRIKKNGGKVLSSVSKSCNLVITKDINSSSSKIKKAKDLGIKVISYEDARIIF